MKRVCVTGASGYLGSWLVKLLLQRGYTVEASVRDLTTLMGKRKSLLSLSGIITLLSHLTALVDDTKKTAHLLSLEGAKERLHLFKANLLEEGSFDAAVDGCEGVFHTASPFLTEVDDPQAEMIDPAVKGTLNVLASCAKTLSIKKVILTSSMAAVLGNCKPRTPDVVVDETWWSDLDFCIEMKMWYVLSKTLAEEAAWKFVKEKGINMVAITPGTILGTLLQPTVNASSAEILALLKGADTYPNGSYGWIDVRDVANAHILAYENPSANGRYCMVEKVLHYSGIVKVLRTLDPALKLPEKCASEPIVPTFQVSNEKAKSLGLEFTPIEQSLKDTIESFKEKGFFKSPTTE